MELSELLEKARSQNAAGEPSATFDRAAVINGAVGTLGDYDCPKCKNKGWIAYNDGDGVVYEPCGCMTVRRGHRRLRESGLSELLGSCRFDNYETPERWQKTALARAREYALNPDGRWLYIFGPPGTGKSHLCTAACGELLNAGYDVRYMLWRDESRELKAVANDSAAFGRLITPLKRCGVLYVDDFLKGGTSEADKRLAFELLNFRYISRRPTLISGELNIDDVLDWDEATGSRIYERARGFVIHANGRNWRLKP